MTCEPALSSLLVGSTVELVPVTEADYPGLRKLELGDSMLHHWRYGAYTPSPDRYAAILWEGVHSQYVVSEPGAKRALGLVMLYDVDMVHGWGYIGAARFASGVAASVRFMEGLGLFIDLSFRLVPLRKLYLDVPEFNVSTFESAIGKVLVEEGRLKAHRFYDGRYWDNLLLAMYRSEWGEFRARLRLGNEVTS